ncbi:MAG: hypothetical protein A3G20_02275 [Acidobacteria bacterium RIFCSPLOWO2_12_FULL_59_11]|nr:MAG: hypothetical protein A3G20_02275 [Acidobacteria bacterium RIFCSPLOWO2_12_FULL_59_11]OFW12497.1 MAG: hypothetical protein A3H27_17320 [Acidobacteria bacterium RIFCSPLOWO2_02_FULL_59_13]
MNWWHFIEQTVIVTTHHDADAFAKLLIPHIETTDALLVSEIDADKCQGWLPKVAWDWIRNTSDYIQRERWKSLTVKPPPQLK